MLQAAGGGAPVPTVVIDKNNADGSVAPGQRPHFSGGQSIHHSSPDRLTVTLSALVCATVEGNDAAGSKICSIEIGDLTDECSRVLHKKTKGDNKITLTEFCSFLRANEEERMGKRDFVIREIDFPEQGRASMAAFKDGLFAQEPASRELLSHLKKCIGPLSFVCVGVDDNFASNTSRKSLRQKWTNQQMNPPTVSRKTMQKCVQVVSSVRARTSSHAMATTSYSYQQHASSTILIPATRLTIVHSWFLRFIKSQL